MSDHFLGPKNSKEIKEDLIVGTFTLPADRPFLVERDFAFLFPKEVKAGEIIKKVKKIDKNIIQNVTIFDVYDGDKLPENKKSIAFRVLLQPQDKTFNEQEIEELSNKIIDEISQSLDASIRK